MINKGNGCLPLFVHHVPKNQNTCASTDSSLTRLPLSFSSVNLEPRECKIVSVRKYCFRQEHYIFLVFRDRMTSLIVTSIHWRSQYQPKQPVLFGEGIRALAIFGVEVLQLESIYVQLLSHKLGCEEGVAE